jgi:hypothetical protein
MPITRERLLTSPSLAPKTAARKLPESLFRPRVTSARTIFLVAFVGSHGVCGVDIAGVRGPRFGALGQGEDKHGSEVAGQEADEPGPEAAGATIVESRITGAPLRTPFPRTRRSHAPIRE